MKLKFIILITSILILPLIILNNEEAFSFALSPTETPAEAVPSGVIEQAVDTADGLDQIHADDTATGFVTIDPQQLAGFPAYGQATLLQEDTGSAIVDLLPTYANGHFVAFYILQDGGTYYLWLNNIQTNGVAYLSVEQRFESQDGLLWSNRTDTNLTQNSSAYRFLRGLRHVIKDGTTYEG